MVKRKPSSEKEAVSVHSYLAKPSRADGEFGPHQPVNPSSPVAPPTTQPADFELHLLIQELLATDGRVDTDSMTIKVAFGIVTLEGEVSLEFQRSLATALTNTIPGVLNVQNQLIVRST